MYSLYRPAYGGRFVAARTTRTRQEAEEINDGGRATLPDQVALVSIRAHFSFPGEPFFAYNAHCSNEDNWRPRERRQERDSFVLSS